MRRPEIRRLDGIDKDDFDFVEQVSVGAIAFYFYLFHLFSVYTSTFISGRSKIFENIQP